MTLTVASAEQWIDNAAVAAWAAGRIRFIRRGTGGLFDGWSALPDGTDERIETSIPAYPTTTHAGISDVSPDGRWMLVTVERAGLGNDGDPYAAPGRGTNNDLWLQESGGVQAWRLRSTDRWWGPYGIIWPRFLAGGSKIVWSERYTVNPFYLFGGSWRLNVADLKWSAAGVPMLANVVRRDMNGLVEPYGATADGARILFCADGTFGLGPNAMAIGSLPVSLAGTPTRLSPLLPKPANPLDYGNYNEFAYPIPSTDRIIFGRTTGGLNGSIEYWTAKLDGSDPQQLTHLGTAAAMSIAGGLAFDPTNPLRFAAGMALDYADSYTSRMVELAP